MEGTYLANEKDKIMINLIDKLCDHLSNERVKVLIDHGFDEWETITYIRGNQLVQMGFNSEECIIIMVAINSNAKVYGFEPIFNQQQIQQIIFVAKSTEEEKKQAIQKEELQHQLEEIKISNNPAELQQEQVQEMPKFEMKEITEQILLKGVMIKPKAGEKINLSKITLISLEEKELTHIKQLHKTLQLQNLYLGRNHIYKMQGLETLTKVKVLKLENNLLLKIENLQHLEVLEQLYLNDNYLTKLEGLTNNKRLHYISVSNQKSKRSFTFQENTCQELAYCLEKLESNSNRVTDIQNLKYLKVLHHLELKNNKFQEIGQLSEPLNSLERLASLDFRGCPIAHVPKYRDYIVILSKTLQQLDNKKILPSQRQYLVKLYSLKHAKQMKEETGLSKKNISSNKQLDLQGVKVEQGVGQHMYNHGADLRGNIVHANTKISQKK